MVLITLADRKYMKLLIIAGVFLASLSLYAKSTGVYFEKFNQVLIQDSRSLKLEVPEDGNYSLFCRSENFVFCSLSLYKVTDQGNLIFVNSDGTSSLDYVPSIHQKLTKGSYMLLLSLDKGVRAEVDVYFRKN